jgi:hypothetical protein
MPFPLKEADRLPSLSASFFLICVRGERRHAHQLFNFPLFENLESLPDPFHGAAVPWGGELFFLFVY